MNDVDLATAQDTLYLHHVFDEKQLASSVISILLNNFALINHSKNYKFTRCLF